jgi:hypothetical protein
MQVLLVGVAQAGVGDTGLVAFRRGPSLRFGMTSKGKNRSRSSRCRGVLLCGKDKGRLLVPPLRQAQGRLFAMRRMGHPRPPEYFRVLFD